MRRMYSENQIKKLAKFVAENDLGDVDLNVASINAKGMAITGAGAITGNLAVGGAITGKSIIENMSGYSFENLLPTGYVASNIYAGAVKNGNKLTLVLALNLTKNSEATDSNPLIGRFTIPSSIGSKIYPSISDSIVDTQQIRAYVSAGSFISVNGYVTKSNDNTKLSFVGFLGSFQIDATYYIRYEVTFLLGENLASSGE